MTRPLAQRAAGVRALDVSGEMLERARAENPGLDNVEWIRGDGITLRPLADRSADVCISYVVLQHLPDPELVSGYIAEMGRVLRPGGWAAFQVSNDERIHRGATGVRNRLAAAVGRGPSGQTDPAWIGSAIPLADLREAVEQAGLEIERLEGEGSQFCLVLARRPA